MNENKNNDSANHKIGLLKYLMPVIIFGLAAYVFLPKITTLGNSMKVVQAMIPWLICLAVIAEICSYLGSGYILKAIMSLGKSKFSVFRGALITLASASIGLVMGGWITSAATTYYWVSKDEDIKEEAALTGILPSLYNDTLLVIIAGIGFAHLLISGDLSQFQTVLYGIIFLASASVILMILYGMKHQNKVEHMILGAAGFFLRLFRQQKKIDGVRQRLKDIYSGLHLLKQRGWKKPLVGASMNIGFDMLSLYFIFLAAGNAIDPVVLIAGYSVSFLLRIAAFFIPGGVGVVESGMVALYVSMGIPTSLSVVVILSYRLFSFWLPSIIGFGVIEFLKRSAG